MTRRRLQNLSFAVALLIYGAPFAAFAVTKIETIITNTTHVANQLVILAFVCAVLVFAWGIVKFITAAGDPQKLQKAKGIIIWGIVGIAVLASITGIIAFIRDYFDIHGNEEKITIPQFQ